MKAAVKKGLIGVGVVGLVAALWAVESHQSSQKKVSTTVQTTRKKDFGFKFKIDECLTQTTATGEKKDFILVDVDDSNTYVLANAEQYFNGPHPLVEEQLVKQSAAELDKTSVAGVSCEDLQKKYVSAPTAQAEEVLEKPQVKAKKK